jgi:hypothetical protein
MGNGIHVDEFQAINAPEYVPGAHDTGNDEMLGQYVPATQGMHASTVGWSISSE